MYADVRARLKQAWCAVSLLCLLAQATLGSSGDLPMARAIDRLTALTNSPLLVTVTLTNTSPSTLRGFAYFDEIPTSLTVTTIAVSINGRQVTNFNFESGFDGDVYAGCTPRRWWLETPTNFAEANPLSTQGVLQVQFALSSPTNGTFALQQFAWMTCKPDKTNVLYGYSTTNDLQTVSFVSTFAPGLPLQTNLSILELTTLRVTNTASDASVPTPSLLYSLLSPPAGAAIDTNGIIAWTPDETRGPGTNIFTTIVTDNATPSLSATNSFVVVVNEVNQAPTLPFQSNRTLVGLQALTLTNTATDIDLPLNLMSYSLQGPAGAVIDTNGIIRWQPTVGQVPGTNSFVTVVTDSNPWAINSQHLSATNSFQVIVNAIHNGPLLPTQTAVRVTQYAALTVTNTALDADLPALGLSYSLLNPHLRRQHRHQRRHPLDAWAGPGQHHQCDYHTGDRQRKPALKRQQYLSGSR